MTPEQELEYLRQAGESDIRTYLASRIRRERRTARMSQKSFAASAGIALRTYKRFESHGDGSLETFVRALKAIGQARNLLLLFPQPLPTKRLTLEERVQALASKHGGDTAAPSQQPKKFR